MIVLRGLSKYMLHLVGVQENTHFFGGRGGGG
jgi:hypothetical protein